MRHARSGLAFLAAFGVVAVGIGAGRAITTTYLPVLLERIKDAPGLIGAVMLVNAATGFLVPLVVGVWSDRRGAGRKLAFVTGGTLLTAGGLVAIALGTETSYLALALMAAVVYFGLNTTATAHRAIVAESFADERRPAATSSQEVAMLVGGLLGVLAGGALIDGSAWLLFAAGALALPLLAVPTLIATARYLRDRRDDTPAAPASEPPPAARLRDLRAAIREPGPREVLLAQILWVMGYAALPAFFILYADHVLGLGAGPASLGLAAFGLLTGAGMLVAGRTRPERVYPRLLLGAALLGGGLLAAGLGTSVAVVAVPFAAAAVGMGLVTALGFPYFARFIPAGQSGRYSGLYFSVRAIASAVALPVAGVTIELTGSYRSLLLLGAAALVALVPLARAGSRHVAAPVARPRPQRVAAVVPCHVHDRFEAVALEALAHVDEVVLVDDGSPPHVAEPLGEAAVHDRVSVLRLDVNSGKGDAVAAGAAALLDRPAPPDAIVVLDADGQHPPERIPDFVAAAEHADVVIGDRRADRRDMPLTRRFTNAVSSALLSVIARRRLPDTQCGMRLYRTDALERVPFPPGRYEAETVHLKTALRHGLAVSWVPIPAIYDGAPSHFRPLRDTVRVLRAIVGRGPRTEPRERRLHRPAPEFTRLWSKRLSVLVGVTISFGLVMPLIGPLDERLFLSIHSLGDGPLWVYEALDPHTRNYILLALVTVLVAGLAGVRTMAVAAVVMTFAGLFSDLLVQAVYLVYDRPRPEEVLAGQFTPTPGHNWAEIASFPSGHLVVTTALAVTAMSLVPALRGPMWIYIGAIALTRIVFGAHFPMDVIVGFAFGYMVGRFSAALPYEMGALRGRPASTLPFAGHWQLPARRLRPADGDVQRLR